MAAIESAVRRNAMKNKVLTAVFCLAFSLSMTSCSGNFPGDNSAPLKNEMALAYKETITYKGRELSKTISLKFVKTGNNLFTCYRTVTDKNGPWKDDPLQVDQFFRYNKIMDYNVSGYSLWRNPKDLASGKIGRMEIIQSVYNGKKVYATILSDKNKAYYDMDTGFLEGAHIDLGDKSQTVVRIK